MHASSGTTGAVSLTGYTDADLAMWTELVARVYGCAGARPGDLVLNAYGYGLFTGGLGFHYGAQRFGCTVIPMSGGNTLRQIAMLRDLRPDILCCTPSYALHLAEAWRESGFAESDLSLRAGIFGAEPWTGGMRREIEAQLRLRAIDVYGLAEAIGPGVSCECVEEQNGLHVFEDHFIVECIDSQTGEPVPDGTPGELVFTSLTKEALPIIRYRTGDISALDPTPCSCGRTLRRMARISGRTDDMLVLRGINVFPSDVEAVLLAIPELRLARLVPDPPLHPVSGDGCGGRSGGGWWGTRRRHRSHPGGAGAEGPWQPAGHERDRAVDLQLRRVRGRAGRGDAVPATGPLPDTARPAAGAEVHRSGMMAA